MIAPDLTETDDLEPTPITSARGKRFPEGAATRLVRLKLRAWEKRLRLAGTAVIVASFPIAFLLLIHSEAHPIAIRACLWTWVSAVAAFTVCGEAVWRHRYRLENGFVERGPRVAGPVN